MSQPARAPLGTERHTIAQHALTVLAGQLAVMAFGVTDTIVAGRSAEEALAALSVGSAIFVSVYVSLMGIFQALLPLWAEHRIDEAVASTLVAVLMVVVFPFIVPWRYVARTYFAQPADPWRSRTAYATVLSD